jgi:hypothetical protein
MPSTLETLRKLTRKRIRSLKDGIGFNLAGLKYVSASIAAERNAFFFGEPEFTAPKRQKQITVRVTGQ